MYLVLLVMILIKKILIIFAVEDPFFYDVVSFL
jgi:hypothetical protein